MALFLNADGLVYGRYGGRTPDSPSALFSLKGLAHSLESALASHRGNVAAAPAARPPRRVEEYAAARNFPDNACLHCHHVYDFRREAMQAAGTWTLDEVWVYPEPGNVGLALNPDRGSEVVRVVKDSAAQRAGIAKGDVLKSLGGRAIASSADVQYALHRAPVRGEIPVVWQRGEELHHGKLVLDAGWRKTDVSWRWSLRGLTPPSFLHGDDLTAAEKTALGLEPSQMAFRQGAYVQRQARQAGININDIILGVDGKRLDLTARQFDAFIRLNYKVGDVVTYNILRDKKRLDIKLKLAE